MSLELKGFISYIVSLAVIYLLSQAITLIFCFYKRCPSDKIIVVRNKKREFQDRYKIYYAKSFVYNPIVEEIKILHLVPKICDVNVERIKTKDDVLVLSFPMTFTYGISICKGLKEIAVEKLLDLEEQEINNLGQKIIQEQVISAVRDMSYQKFNSDRVAFLENLNIEIDKVLNRYGLYVININLRDVEVEENIER